MHLSVSVGLFLIVQSVASRVVSIGELKACEKTAILDSDASCSPAELKRCEIFWKTISTAKVRPPADFDEVKTLFNDIHKISVHCYATEITDAFTEWLLSNELDSIMGNEEALYFFINEYTNPETETAFCYRIILRLMAKWRYSRWLTAPQAKPTAIELLIEKWPNTSESETIVWMWLFCGGKLVRPMLRFHSPMVNVMLRLGFQPKSAPNYEPLWREMDRLKIGPKARNPLVEFDQWISDPSHGKELLKVGEAPRRNLSMANAAHFLNLHLEVAKFEYSKLESQIDPADRLDWDQIDRCRYKMQWVGIFDHLANTYQAAFMDDLFRTFFDAMAVGEKDSLAIPYGYRNVYGERQMIVSFTRESSSSVSFKLFNVGPGLERHISRMQGEEIKYYPYKMYANVPFNALLNSQFFKSLVRLRKDKDVHDGHTSERLVYDGFLKRFEDYALEPVDYFERSKKDPESMDFDSSPASGKSAIDLLREFVFSSLAPREKKALDAFLTIIGTKYFFDNHFSESKSPTTRKLLDQALRSMYRKKIEFASVSRDGAVQSQRQSTLVLKSSQWTTQSNWSDIDRVFKADKNFAIASFPKETERQNATLWCDIFAKGLQESEQLEKGSDLPDKPFPALKDFESLTTFDAALGLLSKFVDRLKNHRAYHLGDILPVHIAVQFVLNLPNGLYDCIKDRAMAQPSIWQNPSSHGAGLKLLELLKELALDMGQSANNGFQDLENDYEFEHVLAFQALSLIGWQVASSTEELNENNKQSDAKHPRVKLSDFFMTDELVQKMASQFLMHPFDKRVANKYACFKNAYENHVKGKPYPEHAMFRESAHDRIEGFTVHPVSSQLFPERKYIQYLRSISSSTDYKNLPHRFDSLKGLPASMESTMQLAVLDLWYPEQEIMSHPLSRFVSEFSFAKFFNSIAKMAFYQSAITQNKLKAPIVLSSKLITYPMLYAISNSKCVASVGSKFIPSPIQQNLANFNCTIGSNIASQDSIIRNRAMIGVRRALDIAIADKMAFVNFLAVFENDKKDLISYHMATAVRHIIGLKTNQPNGSTSEDGLLKLLEIKLSSMTISIYDSFSNKKCEEFQLVDQELVPKKELFMFQTLIFVRIVILEHLKAETKMLDIRSWLRSILNDSAQEKRPYVETASGQRFLLASLIATYSLGLEDDQAASEVMGYFHKLYSIQTGSKTEVYIDYFTEWKAYSVVTRIFYQSSMQSTASLSPNLNPIIVNNGKYVNYLTNRDIKMELAIDNNKLARLWKELNLDRLVLNITKSKMDRNVNAIEITKTLKNGNVVIIHTYTSLLAKETRVYFQSIDGTEYILTKIDKETLELLPLLPKLPMQDQYLVAKLKNVLIIDAENGDIVLEISQQDEYKKLEYYKNGMAIEKGVWLDSRKLLEQGLISILDFNPRGLVAIGDIEKDRIKITGIKFPRFYDAISKSPIEFLLNEQGKWQFGEHCEIEDNQRLDMSALFKGFVICTSSIGYKLLIPLVFYSETHNKTVNLQRSFSTMFINLEKTGNGVFKADPKTRLEKILMAYLNFAIFDHEAALNILQSLINDSPFSQEELQILTWIALLSNFNNDYSPKSSAIRFYVLLMVHANQRWFPKVFKDSESLSSPLDLHSATDPWDYFWAGYRKVSAGPYTINSHELRERIISLYFNHFGNIPKRFFSHYYITAVATPTFAFHEYDMLMSAHSITRSDTTANRLVKILIDSKNMNRNESGNLEKLKQQSKRIIDGKVEAKQTDFLDMNFIVSTINDIVKGPKKIDPSKNGIIWSDLLHDPTKFLQTQFGPMIHQVIGSPVRSWMLEAAFILETIFAENDSVKIYLALFKSAIIFPAKVKEQFDILQKAPTASTDQADRLPFQKLNELFMSSTGFSLLRFERLQQKIDENLLSHGNEVILGVSPTSINDKELLDIKTSPNNDLEREIVKVFKKYNSATLAETTDQSNNCGHIKRSDGKALTASQQKLVEECLLVIERRKAEQSISFEKSKKASQLQNEIIDIIELTINDSAAKKKKELEDIEKTCLDADDKALLKADFDKGFEFDPVTKEHRLFKCISNASSSCFEECTWCRKPESLKRFYLSWIEYMNIMSLKSHLQKNIVCNKCQKIKECCPSTKDCHVKEKLEEPNCNDTILFELSKVEATHLTNDTLNDGRDFAQEKAFSLFEYKLSVKLKNEQRKDLATVLALDRDGNFQNFLIQRMMSYGKTFVLGTLLTFLKADGNHLAVLMPPSSLFESNSAEIIIRNKDVFQQKGFPIKFSRADHYSSIKNLKWIYATLLEAIETRSFVAMPPETPQILENKYIELLETARKDMSKRGSLKPRIDAIQSILYLLKEKGAVTIDEIDLTFDPKKELNFPLTISDSLDRPIIHLLGLVIMMAVIDPFISAKLKLLDNEQALYTNKDREFQKCISRRIVYELYRKDHDKYVGNFWHFQRTNLGITLDTTPSNIKNCLCTADADMVDFDGSNDEKSMYEFLVSPKPLENQLYKNHDQEKKSEYFLTLWHQINNWLPQALEKTHDEHFGCSIANPSNYKAIPYLAAQTPNEDAEFAEEIETFNKTFITYLIKGLNTTQLQDLLQILYDKDMNESKNLKNSHIGSNFREQREELNASLHDDESMQKDTVARLHTYIRHKNGTKRLIALEWLIEFSYAVVCLRSTFYSEQISSNAITMASSFFSIQGYTGTIENTFIFPESLSTDRIIKDRGANGHIMNVLLMEANKEIYTIDYEIGASIETIVKSLLQEKVGNVHALIDLGAYLKNFSNEKVAKAILHHLKDNGITTVIYYDNATDVPAFVKINKGESGQLPEGLGYDYLCKMTGAKEENWFAYYDQRHTTGSDIYHRDGAYAVTTVGTSTTIRDFLQGVFRMRKLLHKTDSVAQKIATTVTKSVKEFILAKLEQPPSYQLKMADILLYCDTIAIEKEKSDNVSVAMVKISNVVRSHLMLKLLKEKNLETKFAILENGRNFFIKTSSSLISRLKSAVKLEDSLIVLQLFIDEKLNQARRSKSFDDGELVKIKEEMEAILGRIKVFINQKQFPTELSQGEREMSGTEVCVMQEQEQEQELEQDQVLESQVMSKDDLIETPLDQIKWPLSIKPEEFRVKTIDNTEEKTVARVHQINDVILSWLPNSQHRYSKIFSDSLTATTNFLQGRKGKRTELFTEFQKEIYSFLYIDWKQTPQSIQIILLSIEDSENVWKIMTESNGASSCNFYLFDVGKNLIAKYPNGPDPAPDIALEPVFAQVLLMAGHIDGMNDDQIVGYLSKWGPDKQKLACDLMMSIVLGKKMHASFENTLASKTLCNYSSILSPLNVNRNLEKEFREIKELLQQPEITSYTARQIIQYVKSVGITREIASILNDRIAIILEAVNASEKGDLFKAMLGSEMSSLDSKSIKLDKSRFEELREEGKAAFAFLSFKHNIHENLPLFPTLPRLLSFLHEFLDLIKEKGTALIADKLVNVEGYLKESILYIFKGILSFGNFAPCMSQMESLGVELQRWKALFQGSRILDEINGLFKTSHASPIANDLNIIQTIFKKEEAKSVDKDHLLYSSRKMQNIAPTNLMCIV